MLIKSLSDFKMEDGKFIIIIYTIESPLVQCKQILQDL